MLSMSSGNTKGENKLKVEVTPKGRNPLKFKIDDSYLEKLLPILLKMEAEED